MPRAQKFVGRQEIAGVLLRGALALLALYAADAAATVQVVTTTTDLQSLTQAVGGAAVEVTSLTSAGQDGEAYQPRPGDLLRIKQAQLVVRVGLDYDLWLDPLLGQAGRAELRRGGAAYVDASTSIPLLEIQGSSVAPGGHAHGLGNPHYWLDPLNAEGITANILLGLARVDPGRTQTYERNRQRFLQTLAQRVRDWSERLRPLQGVALIAHHSSWPYLARRFRLRLVETIEPKPGVPPSPAHLAKLAALMRSQNVRGILKTPTEAEAMPRMLAARGSASVVTLAPSVGAVPTAKDYLALFDYNVAALERIAAPVP